VDPSGNFAPALALIPYIPAAVTTAKNAYLAYRAYLALSQAGSGAYCSSPVDKNTPPEHPDFTPHKKKKDAEKIPWNKNRKGYPDKNGDYWEPVPDGHKGTHNPHWDVQHPNVDHTPKYP